VSDVGLLQVSNHCPALEVLDVSRSELAYKVTDVAMLALGERCHQLTDVNLSGCSFLTDAGIDWLVGGCHLITTLKLPGLYKLTDTGGCRSVWALVSLVCFPQCGVDGKGGRGVGGNGDRVFPPSSMPPLFGAGSLVCVCWQLRLVGLTSN
jgi:hypothetical protein